MTCPSIRAASRKAHALPSERSTKATLAGLVLQLRQRRWREQLEGKIQERYGISKDLARKEVDDWLNTQ
jgi:hypothetical protein